MLLSSQNATFISVIKEHAVAIIRTKKLVGCPPTQHSDSFFMLYNLLQKKDFTGVFL